MSTEEIIAFRGEVMLLSWAESHKGGRTGVFLFDDESEQHPLKTFTTKRGKRAGTRFAMVLVEIDDDETPVKQEVKGGPLSRSAAMVCENEEFRRFMDEWLAKERITIHDGGDKRERCACALRSYCAIESRAELDSNPEAAKRFHELMREFNAYRQKA